MCEMYLLAEVHHTKQLYTMKDTCLNKEKPNIKNDFYSKQVIGHNPKISCGWMLLFLV